MFYQETMSSNMRTNGCGGRIEAEAHLKLDPPVAEMRPIEVFFEIVPEFSGKFPFLFRLPDSSLGQAGG